MPRLTCRTLGLLTAAALAVAGGCGGRAASLTDAVPPELREQSVEVLRTALKELNAPEHRWARVHAAEMLLALDYPQGVAEVFGQELDKFGDVPQYRIGVWRVLSRACTQAGRHDPWFDRIVAALVDDSGPDRLHAVETLGKLGRTVPPAADQAALQMVESRDPAASAFAAWVVGLNDRDAGLRLLADMLSSPQVESRRLAAYALRFHTALDLDIAHKLVRTARQEASDSPARLHLLSAAFVHGPDAGERRQLRSALLGYLQAGTEAQKHEAANALAIRGGPEDVAVLRALLTSPEPDSRIGAAYALLRIGRRAATHMTGLDWTVIAAYAAGMIAVGVYYMRRTRTAEDYLLGGRRMKSWTVGLSLFATLFSTITFLSIPGEMIKNGPMVLGQFLAFPLVYVTIGWLVIPFVMRLRVTSAYEILDLRFGPSVRLLGSLIFLALRLLWMSVIVYATTAEVLVPLLGLDPAWTPWLCAGMGLITIAYTSIGGLRAVVLTDVIQTFILAGGALVCLLLITYALGGVGAWFPTGWAPGWERPRFGFQLDARIALGWMVVGTFLWHFCTSASDQMVIQRYLATRDAKAARRVVLVSLAATVGVICFLALVGFGLLAYFRQHPHMLTDGQSVAGNSDQLLARFIVFALPPGATGLVIAGLLAAAMSSLSAGLNSSCSVITVDLVGRLSPRLTDDRNHLKTAKIVSLAVGAVVVAISSHVGNVPGNLLEIAYRVVNLFTVPLFILFGMAMFVPWATSLGAWAGTLASATAAILIAFWEVFTGQKGPSFLLIMPVALVAGMGTGMIVSLLPVSSARTSIRALTVPAVEEVLRPCRGD